MKWIMVLVVTASLSTCMDDETKVVQLVIPFQDKSSCEAAAVMVGAQYGIKKDCIPLTQEYAK